MNLGNSYTLEQPVEVHLDEDNVLASGDGHVYVHDPFPTVREGLYLFNYTPGTSVPGISAIECFVKFDTFERPIIVDKEEATHAYMTSPSRPTERFPRNFVWHFETLPDMKKWIDINTQIPVVREREDLVEANTEFWELDWKEQRKIRKRNEQMSPTPRQI